MKFNVRWSKKHVNLARRLKNSILRFRFSKILDFEKSNIFEEKSYFFFQNLPTKFRAEYTGVEKNPSYLGTAEFHQLLRMPLEISSKFV